MDTAAICAALGNKTRYQLVKALKEKAIGTCCDRIEFFESGVSVGDVVKYTGLAQSTVSQHLAVLESAGLIRKEKRELWSCYFLNEDVLSAFLKEMKDDLLTEK
ncbi:ArsR/SmtB family transcription factor [Acetanaerobacterium elongatum]|uniref:Transcriptional regulator, ArsR family n=1 Tax=Acetanaerobacterium elongatum TaxID=258515 RepID=A0A1G9ZPU6_9FIRM|nr:metalloregulator ArsR/SmtB family transcription factor [Acetanaerobacterium elongatum]SDN23348.1 transcriptional regulator, ArsR family [Acetanaerobacterium elongatum]